MKKIVVILAAFVLALFVVSCGGDSGETDTNPTDEPTNPTDEPTNPTEEPTNPTDEPTDNPTDEPSNPTDEPTNPTDEPTDPVAETCTEGATRLGETVCGSTQHGKLYQICKDGNWEDTEKCTCDPGEYPEVCGYYGQKMWFTSKSKVATIDLAEGWTRTYFHIVQEQEQDKVHVKATFCNIKIGNSSGLMTVNMPQSFADALGTLDKESWLTKKDDGTFGFEQDTSWELRSIDPACYATIGPEAYQLPSNASDPCVQDWDNDGIPGLRVVASGTLSGTIDMVEKSSSKFRDGWFSEDGQTAGGIVDWTDEQKVLTASSPALKLGSNNIQKENSDQPDFKGELANFFEQYKIPDGSDCAYIVNNAATIFPPDPVELK
ncbi:PT domain-containing protein [bacterium]|nr:PT domain-containing protein [bacterium]